jgi:nucleotide-binding universal stress UspA family protein
VSEKMRILIAYDGSDCAKLALADLQRAGLPLESEAMVLSVADVWILPPPGDESQMPAYSKMYGDLLSKERKEAEQALDEARALAAEAAGSIQSRFPSWDVRAEACADSPAWGVIKKADEWKPDLTVVGSHGRSAFGRAVLGSVSQKVVTHARGSIRVARGRVENDDSPVRIVIGVDGSPYAEVAVEAARRRAWPSGSEALVVAVPELLMGALVLSDEFEDEQVSADKIVAAAAEKLRGSGLSVSTRVRYGDPKRVLVDEAEEWEADSIFVGARGLRAVERFLLGSVSTTVAARAHCSVEVIRAAQTSE